MKTKDEIIQELLEENKKLKARVEELEKLLKTLSGTSFSTPSSQIPIYSKPNTSPPKKKKGAPLGHPGSTRPRLSQDDVQKFSHDPSHSCPFCSSSLQNLTPRSHLVETLLPPQRLVQQFSWFDGHCPNHGLVSFRPPQVSKNAFLSNEVFLYATQLLTDGLSLEKICRHLKERFNLSLTTSGLAQGLQRIALEMSDEYCALQEQLPKEPVLHIDETGARIDGQSHWFWTFVNSNYALYQMNESRSSSVVKGVLGEDFEGVLISDFFSAYGNLLPYKKQKCLAHLLRDLKEALAPYEKEGGRPPPFLIELKELLKEALELKKKRSELSEPEYVKSREQLEERMNALLSYKSSNPNAKRLQKRIRKYRKELLVFLYEEKVEGTNNRAERAIRPAVCQRKMNGGHRSWLGAHTYSVLMTILQTCRLQGLDFIQTSLQILQNYYRNLTPGVLLLP
jgi:transposase